MTKMDLVLVIGQTLTQLDGALADPALIADRPDWQQMYAMRKHLDDQQRLLVAAMIQADDEGFQVLARSIDGSAAQIAQSIKDVARVTATLGTIARIAADLDQVLKLV